MINQLVLLCFSGSFVLVTTQYTEDVKNLRRGLIGSYDRMVRPSQSLNVSIKFNLLSITDLDLKGQVLSSMGWFTVAWLDPRIMFDPSGFGSVTVFHAIEGEIWRPELVVENMITNIEVLADEYLTYRILYTGTVVWEVPVSLKTVCSVDITFFPFDQQTCSITLSSWSLVATETKLVNLLDTVDTTHYTENSEWILVSTAVTEVQYSQTVNSEDRVYSKLEFSLKLKRRSNYYGLNLFLPLIILSVMSVLVFLLPMDSGEKFSYSVTVILAIAVYYSIILDYLPVSKDTSVLAIYMAFLLILAMMTIVVEMIVSKIHFSDPKRHMSRKLVCVTRAFARMTCWHQDDSQKDEIIYKNTDNLSSGLTSYVNGTLGKDPLGTVKKSTLPPVESSLLRKNKVRPKSDSSVKNVKKVTFQSIPEFTFTFTKAAIIWDRFFLLIFSVMIVAVNFTFICVLSVGGST